MNLDGLADILRARGCRTICYFHTDHFEPWSRNVDDESAAAVEAMAEMARQSRYGRKLSLFYSVFIPYGLATGETDGVRASGDGVAFRARSQRQEMLASRAIRPLVEDGHEFHLHVHHEFWTRNDSCFDHPVSRWVNSHSSAELDRDRLDLNFQLCKDAIGREIGTPFERWGFVHGNWALNASDPLICRVDDEMAMMMRHGCFGDFSFPAGRSRCDPRLEAPFTCLPIHAARAYDDPRSDPRAVGRGTGVLRPDRFFIWNSAIKSGHSSLDYYSANNRDLFKSPELVIEQWLSKSVAIDDVVFLKTHAHSMKWEYDVGKPGAVIPHCYPDVIGLFDLLMRVCDRADVEFQLVTVNDVMTLLKGVDDGASMAGAAAKVDVSTAQGNDIAVPYSATEEAEMVDPRLRDTVLQERPESFRSVKPQSLAAEVNSRGSAQAVVPAAGTVLRPPFVADGGASWMVQLPQGFQGLTDSDRDPSRSPLRLLEDGVRFGEGHALHRRIRDQGGGLYSFWKTALWFSTSDGSDPNTNGRTYSIVQEGEDGTLIDVAQAPRTVVAPPPASQSVDRIADNAPLQTRSGLLYTVFGDRHLQNCPVCHSSETVPLWRMPMANLREPISLFGGYFNQVPTLQIPGVLYCFDFCRSCESIFLNPVPSSQKEQYRTTSHYIRKMETAEEWRGYEEMYDSFARWIPPGATVMLDAACGVGQYLQVARRRGTHQWKRMVGLELAEKYVEHMRETGLEAYAFDIDNDDLLEIVGRSSVDFIAFCEAFEHVERPLDALRKLVAVLRPGGRLYFTAQRYGTDVQAAIRPGEPIYISDTVVSQLPEQAGCRIVNMTTSGMRYYIVLEK